MTNLEISTNVTGWESQWKAVRKQSALQKTRRQFGRLSRIGDRGHNLVVLSEWSIKTAPIARSWKCAIWVVGHRPCCTTHFPSFDIATADRRSNCCPCVCRLPRLCADIRRLKCGRWMSCDGILSSVSSPVQLWACGTNLGLEKDHGATWRWWILNYVSIMTRSGNAGGSHSIRAISKQANRAL